MTDEKNDKNGLIVWEQDNLMSETSKEYSYQSVYAHIRFDQEGYPVNLNSQWEGKSFVFGNHQSFFGKEGQMELTLQAGTE